MEKSDLIEKIVEKEWKYFTRANNTGGRASCQNNRQEFNIMRKSQWMTLNTELLESYLQDLEDCENKALDLVVEKYARMMKFNAPEEYEAIKHFLAEISEEKESLVKQIVEIYIRWEEEMMEKYPKIGGKGRPLYSSEDTLEVVSIETYLKGELYSYSENTLKKYYEYMLECVRANKNLAMENIENIVKFKGFESLEEAEMR